MNKKVLVIIGCVLAAGFAGLSVLYFATPADKLPHFLPGYDAATAKAHVKHGIACLGLALGCAAFCWFQSGPKSAPTLDSSEK